MITIYICITHSSEAYRKKNYKQYTEEEFINLVLRIASENGINENSIDIDIVEMNTLGKCLTFLGKGYLCFNEEILKGKPYTIQDVEEVIKHELAHYITDLRLKDPHFYICD